MTCVYERLYTRWRNNEGIVGDSRETFSDACENDSLGLLSKCRVLVSFHSSIAQLHECGVIVPEGCRRKRCCQHFIPMGEEHLV